CSRADDVGSDCLGGVSAAGASRAATGADRAVHVMAAARQHSREPRLSELWDAPGGRASARSGLRARLVVLAELEARARLRRNRSTTGRRQLPNLQVCADLLLTGSFLTSHEP